MNSHFNWKGVKHGMKSYICHCNVSANDGVSHLSAKPKIYVEANDPSGVHAEAEKQLTTKYEQLGCKYISVQVALLKEI